MIDVKYISLLVRGVGLEVGPVAVLGRAIQVVVAFDQLHKLFMHVGKLVFRELILVRLYLRLFQVAEETKFVLQQKK